MQMCSISAREQPSGPQADLDSNVHPLILTIWLLSIRYMLTNSTPLRTKGANQSNSRSSLNIDKLLQNCRGPSETRWAPWRVGPLDDNGALSVRFASIRVH